jgi:hypothetical protein
MANDPLGSLEEFFDFDKLECDTRNHAQYQSPTLLDPSFPALGEEHVMDWHHSFFEESCAIDAFPSHLLSGVDDMVLDHDYTGIADDMPLPEEVRYDMFDSISNTATDPVSLVLRNNDSFTALSEPLADNTTPNISLSVPTSTMPSVTTRKDQPENRTRNSAAPSRKPASAKRKGPPNRIPQEARQMLEEEFATNPYPCSWEIDIIAHQANLDTKRVKNWFNNSRARKKGLG